MAPLQKGYVKAPGMYMNWGGDLAEKLELMLEYDKIPVLGEQWAPVKGSCQDQNMLYQVGKHQGTTVSHFR